MTTSEEAVAIAQEVVDRTYTGQDLVAFFAEDMGPVYLCHFNTRLYVETRDSAHSLGPGPGPIAVPKDGSEPWGLGSAPSFAEQVARRYGTEPPPAWPRRFRRS